VRAAGRGTLPARPSMTEEVLMFRTIIAFLVFLFVACDRPETVRQAEGTQAAAVTAAEELEGDPPPGDGTGVTTTVPDVMGKEAVAAIREVQAAGLLVGLDFPVDPGTAQDGVVVWQEDKGGETNYRGEVVLLGISRRNGGGFELDDRDRAKLTDATAESLRLYIDGKIGQP
jgi:hypothetical protein